MLETPVRYLGWEETLEKTMAVFLLGEFHGRRRLVVYSPWGRKESDRTEQPTLTLFIPVLGIAKP